jgi:hypothetical protein
MKGVAIVLFVLLTGSIAHASDDPFIGTWTMDVVASRYSLSEKPLNMIIVMSALSDGVEYQSVAVQPDGRTVTTEYVADYFGHLALVVGNAGLMVPVSIRKVDSRTVEAAYIRGFKPVALSRRVVSRNGLMMTITTTYLRDSGARHVNVGVYLKARPVNHGRPQDARRGVRDTSSSVYGG